MTDYSRWPYFCLAVSMAVTAAVALAFGLHYEEYQALFHATLSGALTPGTTFNSWYFMAYIGISRVYSALYALIPGVEWIGLMAIVQILMSGTLLNMLLVRAIPSGTGRHVAAATVVLFCSVVLADNIMNFHFARVAYLLCGSSMLFMIIRFPTFSSIRRHKVAYAALLGMFLWGTLTRAEPALGTALLLTCFAVVWHGGILIGLRASLAPLCIGLLSVAGIMYDIRQSDQFHKLVEPDIEMQLTERVNLVPISHMSNARDSLRYEAAERMIWGDPSVITIDFLRSLIALPPYGSWDANHWNRTLGFVLNYSTAHSGQITLMCLLMLLLACCLALKGYRLHAVLVLLFLFGFFIAVTAQTYLVKVRPWSFSPYLAIFSASGFLLAFQHMRAHFWRGLPFVVLVLMFAVHLHWVQSHSVGLREERAYQSLVEKEAAQYAAEGTLLITPASFQPFLSATPPLRPFDFSHSGPLYFYESQLLSIMPGYRDFLAKECGCDVFNLSNFYRFLLSEHHPKRAFVLTTPDRADLIERYLAGIHGLRVHHEMVRPIAETFNASRDEQPLFLYLLRTGGVGDINGGERFPE